MLNPINKPSKPPIFDRNSVKPISSEEKKHAKKLES